MTQSSPVKRSLSPNFENLKWSRRCRASRELYLKSAPQPPSQSRPFYCDQSTQTIEIVAEDVAEPQKSIRRHKAPHKKVDKVIGYLQEIYRWTISTFLKNYITAKYSPRS